MGMTTRAMSKSRLRSGRTTLPRRAPPAAGREWWVFAFSLPAEAAYARVKIWRRLRAVGAVSFKNALYVLPAASDSLEDLEWTLREVCDAGGQGLILAARTVQGMSDQELIALFDGAREEQYAGLAAQIRTYLTGVRQARQRGGAAGVAQELVRFRDHLSDIESIDYFQANGREQALALLAALEPLSVPRGAPPQEPVMTASALPTSKGRTWVTRANVQVDRMASAWLIKRWIDPGARFKFVTDRQYGAKAGEVRFDMYRAEYTHDAERCTFEVLLDLLGSNDAALQRIAQSVHDLDLRDHKFQREETAGIRQLFAGLSANHARDDTRLERAAGLLDDLYQSFSQPRPSKD